MTRIMDLPKEYINQELSIVERAAAVVSTLPVFVYIEPRKPSSETWIDLCGTSYLSVELFISLSSCRATSTDIPDPLSSLLPIVHRLRQVFKAASRILT